MNLLRFNYRSLLLLTTVGGLAAGCETSVDVPTPPHTPRVSLLHLMRNKLTTDTLYKRTEGWLYVGASQQIFSNERNLGRADATVTIADQAGNIVEGFQPITSVNSSFYDGPGYYKPVRKLRGQPGQTYTLKATVPGLEPVESTLTMPFPTVIESASLTLRSPTPGSSSSNLTPARLTVTIQDNAATTDYYLATARLLDAQGRHGPWRPVDLDYTSRENTIEVGRFQLSRSFTDDFDISPYADTNVSGQRFTFTSDVVYNKEYCGDNPTGPCPVPVFMEVTVSTLTPDGYRFLLAKRRYIDTNGSPFSEPASLFSNIKSGYGIFGGVSEVTYRIPLPQ